MTSMLSPSVALLRTQSDERLVALARAGHERAFDAIVERYRRPLLRHSRRLLPESRAEDALQQGLVSAWAALQRGDEVTNLRPWLYRIVHNAALNQLRVNGYDYDELRETLEGIGGPAELAEGRALIRHTFAGLAALPERQRDALLAIAVDGRSQDEVAEDLGMSSGAVRQLVHRARTTLRAAATAVTPTPLVHWLAAAERGSEPIATRVAELVAGGATAGVGATLAKAGAVVVIAGGAATAPTVVKDVADRPVAAARAAVAAPAPALPAGDDDGTADRGPGDAPETAPVATAAAARIDARGAKRRGVPDEQAAAEKRRRGRGRGGETPATVGNAGPGGATEGSGAGSGDDDALDDSSGRDGGEDSSGRHGDDSSGRHGPDDAAGRHGDDSSGRHGSDDSSGRDRDDDSSGRDRDGDSGREDRSSGGHDDSPNHRDDSTEHDSSDERLRGDDRSGGDASRNDDPPGDDSRSGGDHGESGGDDGARVDHDRGHEPRAEPVRAAGDAPEVPEAPRAEDASRDADGHDVDAPNAAPTPAATPFATPVAADEPGEDSGSSGSRESGSSGRDGGAED